MPKNDILQTNKSDRSDIGTVKNTKVNNNI